MITMIKVWIIIGCFAACDLASECDNKIISIEHNFTVADAPIWHKPWNSWLGADLFGETKTLFRIDGETYELFVAEIKGENRAVFIHPIQGCDDEFLVGVKREVIRVKWDGSTRAAKKIETVYTLEKDSHKYCDIHMHCSKTDPKGRFYSPTFNQKLCGTDESFAGLYRHDHGKIDRIFKRRKVPNGLAWNRKTQVCYFFDSCIFNIMGCRWDSHSGDLTQCRVKVVFEKSDEYALSGLDIDTDGNLWAGLYNKNYVIKIDPEHGTILEKIWIDAPTVVGVGFGGKRNQDMLVTSANALFNISTGSFVTDNLPPAAGNLFVLKNLSGRGYDVVPARVKRN